MLRENRVRTKESQPTTIDLFAGVGGLSDGFISAGFQVLAAVEVDPGLSACYRTAHQRRGQHPVIKTIDVRTLDPYALMTEVGLEPGELTALVGGSPCQGFSAIGKRRGDDHRNDLIFEFPRFLRAFESEAFLIENVPGLVEGPRSDLLHDLLDELHRAGYPNATYQIVDAASAGVPQRRLRVVISGTRNGREPDFSELRPAQAMTPTVWDAIRDLPDPQAAAEKYDLGSRIPYAARAPSSYAASMRSAGRLVSHWEPVAHQASTVLAYDRLEPGETDEATKCYRLRPDRPSRTLRAGSRTRTACRPVHPYQPRVVTVREAARLHSFRDAYPLPSTKSGAHVAIGNSVPPLLAKQLGKTLLQAVEL